jgi:glycogen debranching enzyme
MQTHTMFQEYLASFEDVPGYFAGLPSYPRNFSRDTIIAGIIAADHHLLDSQLNLSALHQGTKYDPISGEEPGKIHHEYPGTAWREPYLTTYNACDTTALYLIGLEILRRLDKKESAEFLRTHQKSIESALDYLDTHTKEDHLFWEFPPPGTTQYSIRTTYWKDSIVPSTEGKEEPKYPVSFALAHFQAARGILAAGRLLDRKDLRDKAELMFLKGIETFISERAFCLEIDGDGRLELASSDELHSMAYIPEKYAMYLPLQAIENRALHLITPIGIACTPREIHEHLSDTYHGYVVWIFEQALIHYATRKFFMREFAQLTKECAVYIDSGHELFSVMPEITPRGNTHQLWSVAAKIYFTDGMHSLRQTNWL